MASKPEWIDGGEVHRALTRMGRFDALSDRIRSLLPWLATGRLEALVTCAQIVNLDRNNFRIQGAGAAETKEDWIIPSEAWVLVDPDDLTGGLGNFDVKLPGDRLESPVSLNFLDRSGKVLVRCAGVKYQMAPLGDALSIDFDHNGKVVDPRALRNVLARSAAVPEPAETKTRNARRNAGRKTDTLRWEKFAAALAYLADRGELDLTSESKAHKQVADFLMEKGHADALGVDTVRPLLRRLGAWINGHSFVDDIPEE